MDNILMAIVGSSIIIVGGIAFAVKKVQDKLTSISEVNNKVISDEIKKLAISIDNMQKNNLNVIQNNINTQVSILTKVVSQLEVNTNSSIDNLFDKIGNTISTTTKQINTDAKDNQDRIISTFSKAEETICKLIDTSNSNLHNLLGEVKIDSTSLKSDFEKYQINNKNQLENSFQNTISIINNLRLDNLINVSNEIGKYKNGIVEDEYFLQEVGSCKIIKFTDKQTNETTEVHYNEDGEKRSTQTFLNENLKYEMQYTNGFLSQGVEYNEDNQVIFAYEYDIAGEVSKKIEYEYDKSGNQTEKSKIEY